MIFVKILYIISHV